MENQFGKLWGEEWASRGFESENLPWGATWKKRQGAVKAKKLGELTQSSPRAHPELTCSLAGAQGTKGKEQSEAAVFLPLAQWKDVTFP